MGARGEQLTWENFVRLTLHVDRLITSTRKMVKRELEMKVYPTRLHLERGSRWVVAHEATKAPESHQSTPTDSQDEVVILDGWMDAIGKEKDAPKFDAGWFRSTSTLEGKP